MPSVANRPPINLQLLFVSPCIENQSIKQQPPLVYFDLNKVHCSRKAKHSCATYDSACFCSHDLLSFAILGFTFALPAITISRSVSDVLQHFGRRNAIEELATLSDIYTWERVEPLAD